MKKKFFKKDIDGLIQGISTILSKNRCSLTDEEIALLQDCMKQLKLQETTSNRLGCCTKNYCNAMPLIYYL